MSPIIKRNIKDRLFSKVEIRDEDDCWLWGNATRKGYGSIKFRTPAELIFLGYNDNKPRDLYTHRVVFFLEHDRWPTPLARHTCDNPLCCNPSHIIEGSHKQNSDDKYTRNRAVHTHGETSYNAKVSDISVNEVRRRYALGGISQSALAREYGVSQSVVSEWILYKKYKTTER